MRSKLAARVDRSNHAPDSGLHRALARMGLFAASFGCVAPAFGQERVLPLADRGYFDARFSPDGNFVSYQGSGSLRVASITGSNETIAYTAGAGVSYLWEGSGTLLVTTGDKLMRVTRDGATQRQLANLPGQSIQELFGVVASKVYCTRRSGTSTYVSTINLLDGKLQDIITSVPGVTSLDIDASGKTLLLSETVFLFQYSFWRANLDGSGLTTITSSPLTALARNARWLDGDKTLVLENVGPYSTYGGGWQIWRMDGFNGNAAPITWQPRFRRGAPAVSPDGRWIATYELLTTGDVRAVVFPAGGGGEYVLSPGLLASDNKITWSPDSKSLVYTGTTDSKRKGDVRIFDLDRPLYLAPAVQPGTSRLYSFDLTNGDVGVVFLGVLAAQPITIPGLTGELALDLVAFPPLALASGVNTPIKANFVTPNTSSLIGVELALQGLRLIFGQGLKGAWDPPTYVTILP
ncbi:MAG: PD40 domain-containing protein [Planctomycetes bacterium]|nr:PD40 domain-containing protein [Planctomycetota bacterium]